MSRAAQKEERRRALIDGGVRVLAEHGLEGFTTGRLAKEAGIGQSGFYTYFADRDAALQAVAEHIGEGVLRAIREARQQAFATGQISGAFSGGLTAMLAHREPLRLALRFRREPGPLGDTFRGLVARGRAELYADLVALGLVRADDPSGERLAGYTVQITMGAVEWLIDGDVDDVDAVASDLTRIAVAVLGAWR